MQGTYNITMRFRTCNNKNLLNYMEIKFKNFHCNNFSCLGNHFVIVCTQLQNVIIAKEDIAHDNNMS